MHGLRAICEREGVELAYKHLDPDRGLLGMYIRDGKGRQGIILDRSLMTQPRDERCVMAEEVGHHKTTGTGTLFVVHFSYHTVVEMSRTEQRALRWATEYLMPTPDFALAIRRGRRSIEELADYFFVTHWMVRFKLRFIKQDLRREQGLRVKGLRDVFAPILVDAVWGYPHEGCQWQSELS